VGRGRLPGDHHPALEIRRLALRSRGNAGADAVRQLEPRAFINNIKAARAQIIARTDEDRADFLRKRGFTKGETAKIIETVLAEEGHPPASLFDFVQGITALARDKKHQDARLDLETQAKKLLDRAA
jgi:hypothetical protein